MQTLGTGTTYRRGRLRAREESGVGTCGNVWERGGENGESNPASPEGPRGDQLPVLHMTPKGHISA